MASTITKILLLALYVATSVSSLPTMAGEGPHCGMERLDFSMTDFRFLDDACCGTTSSCPRVGKCFDDRHCSGVLGCEVPGISASATSTFTCAPTQTCATSMITATASTRFITFACFDIDTRIVGEGPGVAKSMPMLFPHFAPTSTYNIEQTVSTTLTQTSASSGFYPFSVAATAPPSSTKPEDAPIATDTPLSASVQPTNTVTPIVQSSSFSNPAFTAISTWPMSAQATPSNTSADWLPSHPISNQTTIIIGAVSGTLTALVFSIVSLDYLLKRMRNRNRHSISDSSDDSILAHHKEEHQMAYGYYGTNRAGIIPKGTTAFEANAEPVELPVEVVADDRV